MSKIQETVSILDVIAGSSDVPAEVLAPPGDYQVRLKGVYYNYNEKSGNRGLTIAMAFTEYPNFSEFVDFINLPNPEDTENIKNKKLRRIDEFKRCFGLIELPYWEELGPLYSGTEKGELKAMAGAIGWVSVVQEQDAARGNQNRVKGSPFNLGGYLRPRE